MKSSRRGSCLASIDKPTRASSDFARVAMRAQEDNSLLFETLCEKFPRSLTNEAEDLVARQDLPNDLRER